MLIVVKIKEALLNYLIMLKIFENTCVRVGLYIITIR